MSTNDFMHALRNKITLIKGYLDLVKAEDVSENSRKFVEGAKEELRDLVSFLEKKEGP